jgi:hypothetical protein
VAVDTSGDGIVFELSASGTEIVLQSFDGAAANGRYRVRV